MAAPAGRSIARINAVPARWESTSSSSSPPLREVAPSTSKAPKKPSAMQKALPILFHRVDLEQFPRLLREKDAMHDGVKSVVPPDAQSPYGGSVTIYNDADRQPLFPTPPPSVQSIMQAGGSGSEEVHTETYLSNVTPLSPTEVTRLHRYNIVLKRVVNMTGKGRVASWYALVIAGNGHGLVGYGEGKDENAGRANKKAFHAAVKNMDLVAVHRSKSGSNTVETTVEGRWGATRVVIRPRPAGFGLRVPNVLHPIARAAGFTDLNAAVYGSSNAMNVVKAALQVLWGGSAPIGMGGGVRGPMRRDNKGQGARSRRAMELSRGRRLEEFDL
ncbi:28S ribosomal protein S5, mitochondrial [Malassezia pachydermatis]